MRKNRLLTFQGRTQTLSAWADEVGLAPSTLQYRLRPNGMTVEEALSTPRRGGRRPKQDRALAHLPPALRRTALRKPRDAQRRSARFLSSNS
jgi:hypothetical protein